MIIGTGLNIVVLDNNGNRTNYTIGDKVNIKKRNYLAESGYINYTGMISSILPNTEELRLDISETSQSKYITIGFGSIMEITKYIDPDKEPEDDDEVKFDYKTKKMIMETIPEMLREILSKLAILQATCNNCNKN